MASTIYPKRWGRIDQGNVVLSKWPIEEAQRIQLALRTDQSSFVQYFYLRRNILKTKINVPFTSNPFYAIVTHTTAFATDDTKQKHILGFKNILDDIVSSGFSFVAGGDLNAIPPNATKTNYCYDDQCEIGDYDPSDEKKGGCDFTEEINWLNDLYGSYEPAITLEQYGMNESKHYSHSPGNKLKLDRKLDYLWTNTSWSSGTTHQSATTLSDHIPITAIWEVE